MLLPFAIPALIPAGRTELEGPPRMLLTLWRRRKRVVGMECIVRGVVRCWHGALVDSVSGVRVSDGIEELGDGRPSCLCVRLWGIDVHSHRTALRALSSPRCRRRRRQTTDDV